VIYCSTDETVTNTWAPRLGNITVIIMNRYWCPRLSFQSLFAPEVCIPLPVLLSCLPPFCVHLRFAADCVSSLKHFNSLPCLYLEWACDTTFAQNPFVELADPQRPLFAISRVHLRLLNFIFVGCYVDQLLMGFSLPTLKMSRCVPRRSRAVSELPALQPRGQHYSVIALITRHLFEWSKPSFVYIQLWW
jgi:hypothetical protein